MKIKSGFLLRKLGEQYVAVAVGDRTRSFSGLIRLNSTGAFLWDQLSEDKTEDELISALTKEFDIGQADARSDVSDFVKLLSDSGFLE